MLSLYVRPETQEVFGKRVSWSWVLYPETRAVGSFLTLSDNGRDVPLSCEIDTEWYSSGPLGVAGHAQMIRLSAGLGDTFRNHLRPTIEDVENFCHRRVMRYNIS